MASTRGVKTSAGTNIYSRFMKMVETVGAAVVAASAVIYLAQVIFRFAFNAPISWSDEVCGHLVVVISYVGAVIALHERNHIRVDILLSGLRTSFRKKLEIFDDLLVILFCGIVAYQGTIITLNSLNVPSSTYPIPLAVPYGVIPLCFLLMGIISMLQLVARLKNSRSNEHSGGGH